MNQDVQRIAIAEWMGEPIVFIPLTQGFVAVANLVDFEHLRKFNWRVKRNGRTNYAISDTGGVRTYMHREVLKTTELIQHKNDDGLNNCRYNIFASCALHNQQFKRKNLNASSQYKGVSWYRRDRRWQASIRINGKSTALGMFQSELLAAMEYDKAALKHFGEHAKLNFPNESKPTEASD